MKNLLAIFLMAFLFASCEGPMGPPGRDGEDGGITYWGVEKVEIKSNEWKVQNDKNGDPAYYSFDYKIKDTDFNTYLDTYGDGLVTAYMYLDHGTNIEAQTPLPAIVPLIESDNYNWREYYSYEYTTDGFVIFTVKYSDFILDQRPPTSYFRIVLTY